MIAVDGFYLKDKYRETLLIATRLDENNQMYHIAIEIVDSENNASYEWFMMRFHEIIKDMSGLAFISDCCTSICRAAHKVFPIILYGLCFYHLKSNLNSNFKNLEKLWKYSFSLVFL